MKIWFRLHGFEPCSWTSVWEELRPAFTDIGVEVQDISPPDNPEEYIELWWGDPQFFRWSDLPVKARVSLALSEAHSILTKGRNNVISNLRKSDLIICPSDAATLAFREAPMDVPIRVSHFGISPEEFPYVERDWTAKLCFLHAGVTQFRKGSWLVPEAFIATFNPADNVQLTIAAPRSTPMFTKLNGEYGRCENIVFRNGRTDSMMSLFQENHIYVSPHLSEGFGLMPLEAMATGMCCIMSRCSAPMEYFDKSFGGWIEMSEHYVHVAECLPDTNGFWRLPDIDSLGAMMRRVYMTKREAETKGMAASDFAHSDMTWRQTALSITEHIKEILDEKDFGSAAGVQRGEAVTGPSGKYLPAR